MRNENEENWFKSFRHLLKAAGKGFISHNMIKLSASLSFFAIFSIGPMMLMIILVARLFFKRQVVEGSLFRHLNAIIGEQAGSLVHLIIKNAFILTHKGVIYIGVIVLFIAATGVFNEIHNSMNIIWNLTTKKGRGLLNILKSRMMSFIIITLLGILLLLSLFLNTFLEGFRDKIQSEFPNLGFSGIYVTNQLITVIVVASLFAVIFKYIPDAILKWKDVLPGALFTSVLFMFGKYGLTFYISNSDVISSYNSAGSILVLLAWIFYSSLTLYFGAEFTKAYAMKYSGDIKPRQYATTVKVTREISNAETIQENEVQMKNEK